MLQLPRRGWISVPGEFYGGLDVGVKALVDGAGVSSALQLLPVFKSNSVRNVDLYGEARNHSRRSGRHLLLDRRRGPCDIDVQGAGHNAHDRQHAGAKRSREQVCRRKALATPLIIYRGIGAKLCTRRAVDCFAVQVSLIFELNGNHHRSLEIYA